MFDIDLYALATQGQISDSGFPFLIDGFSIFIDEEVIEVPVVAVAPRRGGGGGIEIKRPTVQKKALRIKIHNEELGINYDDTIIVDNINLSVSYIRERDNDIYVTLKDINDYSITQVVKVTL